VVVGETPYAETNGDSLNLTIPGNGYETINNVCSGVKCVVVLITGRPVVIQPYLNKIDGLVAAWLPGSEGSGVADVLFGDYGFTGKLPRTWFKTVDQLPMNVGDSHYDPLFPFGFGLTTEAHKITSEYEFVKSFSIFSVFLGYLLLLYFFYFRCWYHIGIVICILSMFGIFFIF
jgi:beta-glucosidase